MEFGVTNTTQFEKEGGEMICKGCGKVGEYVACSARRYLSYRSKAVTVYHIGNHTCPVNYSLRKKVTSRASNKLYGINQTSSLPRYNRRSSCPHFSSKWTGTQSKERPVLYWIRSASLT